MQVATTLGEVFKKINIAQSLKQSTRAALISYASSGTIIADLKKYTNTQDLMTGFHSIKPSNDAEVNVLE